MDHALRENRGEKAARGGREKALSDAVHAALVEALKIPEHDRMLRLIEHAPGNFQTPPGTSDKFTLVEITMFPGRSLEAKKALYKAVVRNLGALGIPSGDVRILLHEPPLENWGLAGGILASEAGLGFKIDVRWRSRSTRS